MQVRISSTISPGSPYAILLRYYYVPQNLILLVKASTKCRKAHVPC